MALVKDQAILYIDRNRLTYFVSGLSNVVGFDVPLTCINDLEVISKDELAAQIKIFVKDNKLQPGKMALIMAANTYFEKDYSITPPPQEQQTFLDSVPFERILSKVFHVSAFRLIAINTELYEAIRNGFEEEGFFVESLTPASVVTFDFKSGLTVQSAQEVLKHIDTLKTNSIIASQGERTYSLASSMGGGGDSSPSSSGEPHKKENPLVIIGLILFILVVVVLAILYSLGIIPPKPAAEVPVPVPQAPVAAPIIPTATPEVASSAAVIAPVDPGIITISVAPSGVKVQIFALATAIDKANAIKNSLTAAGFTTITIAGAANIATTQTSIEFAANLPQDIRDRIISQVRLVTPDISGVDNKTISAQVNITLGRPQ